MHCKVSAGAYKPVQVNSVGSSWSWLSEDCVPRAFGRNFHEKRNFSRC